MKDKNIKTILYLAFGLIILSVSSYLIYTWTYVEPIYYDTILEIYKNENDYRIYLKNDQNKKLVGYNLYKTIGLNLNNEEILDLSLNTSDNNLNGIIIHYKSDYYSYYNLDNNKNLFKDLKLKFANWSKNYIATTNGINGQFGIYYNSIYDIYNKKIVLDNLNKLGQSNLYFLKSNDKNYFYIDSFSCEYVNTLCNKINIYDDKGSLIYTTENKNGYIVDFQDIPTTSNMTYDVNGYYEEKDNFIKKYNFNHQEIKSNLYDQILFVGMFNYVNYNLVYKEEDNSIYIISNDEKFMRKISIKKSDDYCLVRDNENINVYETKCNYISNANSYFSINIKNNQITEILLNNNIDYNN